MTPRSNTTTKQQGGVTGKGFVKGDPRINRKGRPSIPKSQVELNALIDEILLEETEDSKGNRMQNIRILLKKLILAKNPTGQIHILDRRYGKVPQAIEGELKGEIILRVIREANKQNDT